MSRNLFRSKPERGVRRREARRSPLSRAFWVGACGLLVLVAAVIGWAAARSGTEYLGAALAIALPNVLPCIYVVHRAAAMKCDDRWRSSAIGAAWSIFLVSSLPAANATIPGEVLFEGYLARPGDAVMLPASLSARVRLLFHGHLSLDPREGEVARAHFMLSGAAEPVEGVLERARVLRNRGGKSVHVIEERNISHAIAEIPVDTRALTLERLTGPLEGRIRARGYSAAWPRWVALGLAVLAYVGMLLLDLRLGTDGDLVAAAAVAIMLGALTTAYGTPTSLTRFFTVAQFGAAMVALLSGVVAGWSTQRIAKWKFLRNNLLCPPT